MRYLDLSLSDPAENLALDEALLEEAEAATLPVETLRLWESERPMVVLGRSSKIEVEVDLDACRRLDVPVLRRISGGAAVLAGPGCLMYAIVLDCRRRPGLRAADEAHRFVLGTMTSALRPAVATLACRGTSDLAIGLRKISGNSLRLRRDHVLYHGTLLYDFPLDLVARCLKMPPRVPDYRQQRAHADFLANLPLGATALRRLLRAAWAADEPRADWPRDLTARLAVEKYRHPGWIHQGRQTI